MRAGVLVLLVLAPALSFAPAASAGTCVASAVCAYDDHYGTCPRPVGYGGGDTEVDVTAAGASAEARGFDECYRAPDGSGYDQEGVEAEASAAGAEGEAAWKERNGVCTRSAGLRAFGADRSASAACPDGPPPNPGWGRLLP